MPRERIATWPTGRASRFSAKTAETLAAARTITIEEVERYNAFAFDPGGAARTVTLPAESACEGVYLFIANTADAAEVLTVQDDGASTIVTPTQAEAAFVWCDGVRWYGMVGASS
ncbi:hypothetical protein [Prauserella muralis]|uniref:Uncharacterized protein n=1 Tax=Prauserella muralis TaxID=588067 RepID=A0A2V4AYY3_9PSEU|nr:hypothetical protein [Prauserella muralis]PXY21130.1 hypothetical protein BAY60_27065 [Prauserella muralis]TWE30218.1 hypothetical protein FHX69_2915 [Prauserella muralis]